MGPSFTKGQRKQPKERGGIRLPKENERVKRGQGEKNVENRKKEIDLGAHPVIWQPQGGGKGTKTLEGGGVVCLA